MEEEGETVQRIRGSRWRHGVVLAPALLIELALAIYFFYGHFLALTLPLFVIGALSTAGAYAVLLRRWPLTPGPWSRFALSLACAFTAFQVSLLLFGLVAGLSTAAGTGANALGVLLLVLLGGNVLFFPVWLLLGGLAYGLLRFTEPPSDRPAPSPRRGLRR